MEKIIHHFRRNRSYQRRDRWMVFTILAVVTMFVLFVNWSRLLTPAENEVILTVKNTNISQDVVATGSTSFSNVTIQLQYENGLPAKSIWVGLKVHEPSLRTPEFTYSDWYSHEPDRSFYQTDSSGRVKFPVASHIAGEVEYHIYTADPDASQNKKYLDLNSNFVITFE